MLAPLVAPPLHLGIGLRAHLGRALHIHLFVLVITALIIVHAVVKVRVVDVVVLLIAMLVISADLHCVQSDAIRRHVVLQVATRVIVVYAPLLRRYFLLFPALRWLLFALRVWGARPCHYHLLCTFGRQIRRSYLLLLRLDISRFQGRAIVEQRSR